MTAHHPAALVPGRACGACTVCCEVSPVDTPEFQKQAGVRCGFCEPEMGCSIHATRPSVCRDWFCGWRELPLLDDAWRPDRSGLLIMVGADEVAPGFAPYSATRFVVTGAGAALGEGPFLSYLAGLVHARAAAYLAVPGPPRHHAVKALLNGRLASAVAKGDGQAMRAIVRVVFDELRRGPFEPVELRYGGGA